MDERHWWMVSKIRENLGVSENATTNDGVGEFIGEPDHLEVVSEFYSLGGPQRLFIYRTTTSGNKDSSRLGMIVSLSELKDVRLEEVAILYFFRPSVGSEVEMNTIDQDIHCGLIKGNVVENLQFLLSEVYVPILKVQRNGRSPENQTALLQQLRKSANTLSPDTGFTSGRGKPLTLRLPDASVNPDFKYRITESDQQVVKDYEELMTSWIVAIETVLADMPNDRLVDPYAGPLSELSRQRRRLRLLTSITDQLKVRECKSVMAVVIMAKSKLMKKWKQVDLSLTDALNETKDKVRFLESLERNMEQLYGGATPAVVMTTVLPSLVKALKDSDSVSRFYARQGYLGIVFVKVTNQLVQVCKDYVEDGLIGPASGGQLWQQLWQEAVNRKDESTAVGQNRSQPNVIMEKIKLRVGRNLQKKMKTESVDDGLLSRLRSCLLLQSFYHDLIRSVREYMLASRNMSHLTSLSSGLNMTSGESQTNPSKVMNELKPSDSVSVASLNVGSTTQRVDFDSPGVALGDEETILAAMSQLCGRFQKIVESTNAFSQFHRMSKDVGVFPRPRLDDFLSGLEVIDHQRRPDHPESSLSNLPNDAGNLQSIHEDDESAEKSDIGKNQRSRETTQNDFDDPLCKGPSRNDIKLLRKYFPESQDPDDGPRVSDIFSVFLMRLEALLRNKLKVEVVLNMGSGQFGQLMTDYAAEVNELETFLIAYLNVVVIKSLRIADALNILTSFAPVQNRSTFSGTVTNKYRSIFLWYEEELEELCRTYEKQKEQPPLAWNAPQVGGAIGWARQLLRKIEEPMRVFRICKAVSGMREYGRVVKRYNQLGKALATYEGLWMSQWKERVDEALEGLKLPLFVIHPDTREILVNEDSRVLELIHEAKWLQRFQIELPDSAYQMLNQEARFKRYRDQLIQCVIDFKSVCDSIQPSVRGLFDGRIRETYQNFLPGLNKFAWDSTNIDVFLHQINSGINRLRDLVEKVNDLIVTQIQSSIESIRQTILIDVSLAVSKPWAPRSFAEAMKQSILKKSDVLKEHLSCIVMAVNEGVSLINEKPGAESRDVERRSLMKILSQQVATLLDFYRRDIDDAIICSTVTSLQLLADSCDSRVLPEGRTLSAVFREASQLPTDGATEKTTSLGTSSVNDTGRNRKIRFELQIKFGLPSITVEPDLDEVHSCLMNVATEMVTTSKGLVSGSKESLTDTVSDALEEIGAIAQALQPSLRNLLKSFSVYEFLWKDDVIGNFREFVHLNRETYVIVREVERLLAIEHQVTVLPPVLHCGSIYLVTHPIKETLVGFAAAWKNLYASGLMEEAKRLKDIEVTFRNGVHQKLREEVVTLDQLNDTLNLLEEIRDMENKIDGVYRPIEELYMKIRVFEPRLSRSCDEEVERLRDNWQELLAVAERVYMELIREKRGIYEQELDKQVKMFVVEVMQFRNAFDSQGPSIPGIDPLEAMSRLDDFQKRYDIYEAKRQTIDSVSKLFSIPCKPFPELDRTGEELKLLSLLYTLYQKFLDFNRSFRDCLWADVDLNESSEEVNGYWLECQGLPNRLKDWQAYVALRTSIAQYIQIFPILKQLASKEIRSRHWMKVMRLTGSSFQLEANVFQLAHVLDIELIKCSEAIGEICRSARHELDLETKLHTTEDEWTEQVLSFAEYKNLGPVCLSLEPTQHLLDQLEDARATLALMLTSKYIGPLREEVAGWAQKLKDVQQVLDHWLKVQELWSSLEAIFATSGIEKVLPRELRIFRGLDQNWKRMMKKAYDIQNAVQCCFLEGAGTYSYFDQMLRDLESCFKRLSSYLDSRRSVFPRLHFVSDQVLLKILSGSDYVESVKPHLRSFFSAIKDFIVEMRDTEDDDNDDDDDDDIEDDDDGGSTKSLKAQEVIAVYVISQDGDHLSLTKEVPVAGGVDSFLAAIKDSVSVSLRSLLQQIVQDVASGVSCEEWVQKYPGQVCCLGFLFQWTRDCEQAMSDGKADRSALMSIYRRTIAALNSLLSARARDTWKNSNVGVNPLHRLRLEAMIAQAMLLRDITENFSRGKIKEVTDFEWRRNLRLYLDNTGRELMFTVLDERFAFGYEFYSAGQLSGFIPASDKCFISIVLAMAAQKNCAIVGDNGVGKTETVKNVAMMTGHHVAWFYCNETSAPSAIGRFVQGAAMDGCWSCFDAVHLLQRQSLKMLIDNVQSVMDAVRAKLRHCVLPTGCQIPIKDGFSTFLTFERGSSVVASILPDIHSQFREVALIRPETSMILVACCSRLGLKAPSVLASKLKQVVELVRDQLPAQVHHNVSLQALVAVIQCAAQKKRLVRNSIAGMGRPNRLIQSAARNRNIGTSKSGRTTANNNRPKTETKPSENANPTTPLATNKSDVAMAMRKQSSRKFSSKPLSANIQNEHGLVGQLLIEVIGPRFSAEHSAIFRNIVKDFFPGIIDSSRILRSLTAVDGFDLESSLDVVAKERSLVPLKTWNQKCLQLYSLSLIYTGVVVAGSPCTGKSTIVRTLIEALDNRGSKSAERPIEGKGGRDRCHRLQRFYPLATDSLDVIFGSAADEDGDWMDGMLTVAWKKATKMGSRTTTWLCFDGPLTSNWTDQVTCVLGGAKTLNLSNGDQLDLTPNIKVLFETEDLSTASPGFLARTGILFIDPTVVGWRPIAKAWLDTRTKQEVNVLQKAFEKTIDRVWMFVSTECRAHVPLTEVGLFTTCVNILSAMLADNREIGGDVHIERLFLFCLMWTFGGLLDQLEQKAFSDLLMTISNALPDDDQTICIFDYYVDEAGDWDPWQSKVPEVSFGNSWDLLGQVFVDTIDTIRTKMLANFALASGQSVLIVGPTGSGKTVLANDLLNTRDLQSTVVMEMVASGATSARQMQQFIEANLHHRQGYTYGAKDMKQLQLFIDDINLPRDDECNVPRCCELLRRILDERIISMPKKPFEHRTIEGLTLISTINLSSQPSLTQTLPNSRLLRHFAVLHLSSPNDSNLSATIYNLLEANLLFGDHDGVDIDIHNGLVSASVALLKSVTTALRPSPLPGRQHYLFSLKDIDTCFQTFKLLADESRADEEIVVSLWKHEMNRVVRDCLCRHADIRWFDETMNKIVEERWPELADRAEQLYINFSINPDDYRRPNATHVKRKAKQQGILQPVDSLNSVRECLTAYLDHYNNEFSNTRLNIQLTDNVVAHVIRLHRILSYSHQGNALLIGSVGSNIDSLIKLALHLAGLPIHRIDSSRKTAFFDGLRSAVRLAGTEDKRLALVFSADDLSDAEYVDAIHSILVTGIYPHLFTNDEMDGLLLALMPVIRKHYRQEKVDPFALLLSRIKTNLRIIVSLPPQHHLLSTAIRDFPALLTRCQVMWLCDWSEESLFSDALHLIHDASVVAQCQSSVTESLAKTFANIHSHMLTYCCQITNAGLQSEEIKTGQLKKRKGALKLLNRPYSKMILHENIQNHELGPEVGSNAVFVGPSIFHRFSDTFFRLFSSKETERSIKFARLKSALETLNAARRDSRMIKDLIKTKTKDFESAEREASDLQRMLTSLSTRLEKRKASLGMSTSLSAYLQLNEPIAEDQEEDELLRPEARDEYDDDFDRMREATLKSRQEKAKEELAEVTKNVELMKKNLAAAKEQILLWKSKVNRQCIEKLKSAQNPTVLVGNIIEMVMLLVGKRSPGQRLDLRGGLDNYPLRDEQSGKFSASSSSTRVTTANLRKIKTLNKDGGMSDRFDHQQWKAMQRIMSDTVRFVEQLHNIPWEDGIAPEVIAAVESYLARSPEGQLGVAGEGSQQDSNTERNVRMMRRSPSPDNTRGITVAAAKFSSEDAATLVQYVIAIVEYTQVAGPLVTASNKQLDLEAEIAESERRHLAKLKEQQEREKEEHLVLASDTDNSDDLEELKKQLNQLQTQLDLALVHKHSLHKELESMTTRLRIAIATIESLRSQETDWTEFVKFYATSEVLVANCVVASAFLTYCGSMTTDARKQTVDFYLTVCSHHHLPQPPKLLFRDIQLIDFLYPPTKRYEMRERGLSRSLQLMLDNTCFMMQGDNLNAWHLISDTTRESIEWLKRIHHKQTLTIIKYPGVRPQLDACLAEGLPILVTDVDVTSILHDQNYLTVLHSRSKFMPGQPPVKLRVGNHEVECRPGFRLYLHTSTPAHLVPAQLAAIVSLLNFHQTKQDVEEHLLDIFLRQEKARICDELITLAKEQREQMSAMIALDEQMASILSENVDLLNNVPICKKLSEMKKNHEEAEENQLRAEDTEKHLMTDRESFRLIARRGTICWETMTHLHQLNPVYETSFHQFITVFRIATSHSDRVSQKVVMERIIISTYSSVSRFLLERDKNIYRLLLAIELEEAEGRVGLGEREFLISPILGSVTMTALHQTQGPSSPAALARKPFDWMLEEQFNNLQLLAIHYKFFEEMFDHMARDGHETQWRTLCESEQPELQQLPEKMDDQLTALQRMLIIRAVRSDRLLHLASLFVASVLGKRYCYDMALDGTSLIRQSSPITPILMLYTSESEAAENVVKDVAKSKDIQILTLTLGNVSAEDDEVAIKDLVKTAASEGMWVLLRKGHSAVDILDRLDRILGSNDPLNSQFRCWVIAQTTQNLTCFTRQTFVKVLIDDTKTIKDTLIRSFIYIDAKDILRQSSRKEWPAVMHNICYLHGAIHLRRRLGYAGWNAPLSLTNISTEQLYESFQLAASKFQDSPFVTSSGACIQQRIYPWTELRFMLSEVVYGKYVSSSQDQQILSAMIDYWISPFAVKKDFELPKIKYRLGPAYFLQNARVAQMVQVLEDVANYQLEVPEACSIHSSAETLLGDDQYVFTRLNRIYDAMPSSGSLSHQLFVQPPSPSRGLLQANVSTTSNNAAVLEMGVFSSASYVSFQMKKEVDLYELCNTMLRQLPKGYTKESVAEKIKKIGGMTSFNLFIIKEIDLMQQLLNEIRNTLQAIKTASESSTMGDILSPDHLQAASDLYHQRIPQNWRHLAGHTAPPPNQALASWMAEVNSRCQHFDRILFLGRERMPSYWLGAFFYPRSLLALLKQDCVRHQATTKNGNVEQLVFQTEITARDKDHIRDPPSEGLFVFGIYLWGCLYDKTTGELVDCPSPRGSTNSMLPVIHVTCWPRSEKPLLQDAAAKSSAGELYTCPIYHSRCSRQAVLDLDLGHSGIPASRWTLRGLFGTIRPY